jgi:hypothetical protein
MRMRVQVRVGGRVRGVGIGGVLAVGTFRICFDPLLEVEVVEEDRVLLWAAGQVLWAR